MLICYIIIEILKIRKLYVLSEMAESQISLKKSEYDTILCRTAVTRVDLICGDDFEINNIKSKLL